MHPFAVRFLASLVSILFLSFVDVDAVVFPVVVVVVLLSLLGWF